MGTGLFGPGKKKLGTLKSGMGRKNKNYLTGLESLDPGEINKVSINMAIKHALDAINLTDRAKRNRIRKIIRAHYAQIQLIENSQPEVRNKFKAKRTRRDTSMARKLAKEIGINNSVWVMFLVEKKRERIAGELSKPKKRVEGKLSKSI